MKIMALFIFGAIIINLFSFHIEKPVHLLFNYEDNTSKRVVLDNGDIDFYQDKVHFYFNAKKNRCKTLKNTEIAKIEFLSLDAFQDLANSEREKAIRNQEREGTITIMFNDKIFKNIYLYDRISNKEINRYEVIWVEEIE